MKCGRHEDSRVVLRCVRRHDYVLCSNKQDERCEVGFSLFNLPHFDRLAPISFSFFFSIWVLSKGSLVRTV
jgi:hypothetical protein